MSSATARPTSKIPLRAITIKGNELRAAIRNGNPLDRSDLHERFVELWQEARLAIWRAKHSKAGIPQWDAQQAREVLTFTVDEKQVIAAIDTTRGILDSLIKLRREMGHESTRIPRWPSKRSNAHSATIPLRNARCSKNSPLKTTARPS
jgi:hypothetical protein